MVKPTKSITINKTKIASSSLLPNGCTHATAHVSHTTVSCLLCFLPQLIRLCFLISCQLSFLQPSDSLLFLFCFLCFNSITIKFMRGEKSIIVPAFNIFHLISLEFTINKKHDNRFYNFFSNSFSRFETAPLC